mmetsp:Transcript_33582/g.67785  ORF Transcript_33582/g.67785 Transcript_33582/m.67785 type:complete len:208 (+) Transcript_33582:1116-1739(+)
MLVSSLSLVVFDAVAAGGGGGGGDGERGIVTVSPDPSAASKSTVSPSSMPLRVLSSDGSTGSRTAAPVSTDTTSRSLPCVSVYASWASFEKSNTIGDSDDWVAVVSPIAVTSLVCASDWYESDVFSRSTPLKSPRWCLFRFHLYATKPKTPTMPTAMNTAPMIGRPSNVVETASMFSACVEASDRSSAWLLVAASISSAPMIPGTAF